MSEGTWQGELDAAWYIGSEGTWQGELDAAWYHRGVKVLGKVSWMQPGMQPGIIGE